jgi:octaprenyl-diphosphate synthase
MRVHDQNISKQQCGAMTQAFELVKDELNSVKEFICDQLVTGNKDIDPLLKHVTARSGKMIRPGLVLTSAGCCGQITDTHINLAAITEMIHIATLLHDDVIDEAETRRNDATANVLWGNESAVLLGDMVLSKVFELCSKLDMREYFPVLSETTTRICQGELSQNIQQRNFDLTVDEYLKVISDKTASLFACSCLLGAKAAGADHQHQEALFQFGTDLGIAFQITDDLLDIIGSELVAGKTLGTDIEKCKLTLPVIHLLENADPDQKTDIIEKLKASGRDYINTLLDESGSIDHTRSVAKRFCGSAINSLRIFPDSPAKQALIKTANSITEKLA